MVEIFVLGTIQDGGLPQIGCSCANCKKAISLKSKKRFRCSIAIKTKNNLFLVDATPDIEFQYQLLMSLTNLNNKSNKNLNLSGIILTHLHSGHYTGLVHLGKESVSTRNLPVYMTPKNELFISSNKPYSYLVERNEIKPKMIHLTGEFLEGPDLSLTAIEVPHRNEDGDTIGLVIRTKSSRKSLIYIPDIDFIPKELGNQLLTYDIVILDGTFFSKNEIKRQKSVPHPAIKETIEILGAQFHNNFFFTHFNHSNPVLNPESEEYKFCLNSGYKLLEENLRIKLS